MLEFLSGDGANRQSNRFPDDPAKSRSVESLRSTPSELTSKRVALIRHDFMLVKQFARARCETSLAIVVR